MVVTTSFLTLIMIIIWQTHLILVLGFLLVFGSIDLLYFSSVLYKFDQGGYLPLAFAAVLLFVMYVWHYVYKARYLYEMENEVSKDALNELVLRANRVPGIGLLYTELVKGVPCLLAQVVNILPALHSLVVFVSVKFLPVSTVLEEERFLVRRVGSRHDRMYRCVARYGYRDLREDNEVFQGQLLAKLANFISCELEGAAVKYSVDDSASSDQQLMSGKQDRELDADIDESRNAHKSQEIQEIKQAEEMSMIKASKLMSDDGVSGKASLSHDEGELRQSAARLSTNGSSSIVPINVESGDKINITRHSSNSAAWQGDGGGGAMQELLRRKSSKWLMKEAVKQEELKFLQESKDAGVVYLLGHSNVRASNKSPLLKRFIINYAYEFLRRNCRSGSDALIVPHHKLLEVGMIYYI